jgi:hypothetical protein
MLIRRQLEQEDVKLVKKEQYDVGQWVVYALSEYERKKRDAESGNLTIDKYSPTWSMPCKVVQVKDKALEVVHIGAPDYIRQVPISGCRLLEGPVPEALAKLNVELIKKYEPRFIRYRDVHKDQAASRSWNQIVEEAQVRQHKRQR